MYTLLKERFNNTYRLNLQDSWELPWSILDIFSLENREEGLAGEWLAILFLVLPRRACSPLKLGKPSLDLWRALKAARFAKSE